MAGLTRRDLGRDLHDMWRKNLEVMQHPSANQVKRFDELDLKTQEVFSRTAEEFIDEHCPSDEAPSEVPRG